MGYESALFANHPVASSGGSSTSLDYYRLPVIRPQSARQGFSTVRRQSGTGSWNFVGRQADIADTEK
jgi:hypothetical protein